MKKAFLTLALIISFYFGFSQTTGSFQTTIRFNSTNHTVAYYVPTTYDSTKQYPMVVALHGCGGNAVSYRNSFISISDSLDAILVCPDFMGSQITGANGLLITRAIDSTIIDLNYNIDTTKVYLTGFSCNGQETMKQGWANIYPFRGLIPLNAWTPNLTGYNYSSANIPTCICSGTSDGSHARNLSIYNSLITNGKKARWNPMPGIPHTSSFATRDSEMMECFNWLDTLGQSAASRLCASFSASASSLDTICLRVGTSSVIIGGSPSATGGTSPYTYSWSNNPMHSSVSDSTLANPIATVFSTYSTFILTVTDSAGCIARDTVVLDTTCYTNSCPTLRASASAMDTICLASGSSSVTIGGSPSATGGTTPYSYSWISNPAHGSLSDSTLSNPLATVFSAYSSFILTVTDTVGCIARDTVVIDTACSTTSIVENDITYKFSIYPNPSKDNFRLSFNDELKKVSVKIISVDGAILLERSNLQNDELIDITQVKNGAYIVYIYSDSKPIGSIKLMIMR